jgi:molybdopterin molybdotransferase
MRSFQSPAPGEPLLSVEKAQAIVLETVRHLDAVSVRFQDAAGRVLREDITAAEDVPAHDNSAMDGYAVLAADTPGTLRVAGDIGAGRAAAASLRAGEALRIMTGAPIPDGADAVANVEITDGGSESVTVRQPLTPGRNIRRRGEDMRAGQIVLGAGTLIRPAEVGVLATARRANLAVGRKPRVAVLATGDEIASGATANSNSHALAALIREAGGEPTLAGVVRDDRDATIDSIRDALEFDFIVSTGGVSVGAYDYVREALQELGADFKFWRVAMKPGKPVLFATAGDCIYFGLPGNPVSSIVAFVLFVAPALRKAAGQTRNLLPPMVMTRVSAQLRSTGDQRNYLRVRVSARDGELHSDPMPAQGSGVSTSLVQANGLAIVEEGTKSIDAGTLVPTILWGQIFGSSVSHEA